MTGRFNVLLRLTFIAFFCFSGTKPAFCDELRILKEIQFKKLLDGKIKHKNHEASGVVFVNNEFYVVFDNLSQIARINVDLNTIELLGRVIENTGYEGITYDPLNKEFYLIEESIEHKNAWNARLSIVNNKISSEPKKSWLKYKFKSDKKGFEGVTFLRRENKIYILALCEGNACKSGSKGKKPGTGMIQVFEKMGEKWKYITSIKLPKTLEFIDYSGIDIRTDNKLAITSQESSAIWVSKLSKKEWKIIGSGKVYPFPKNKEGKRVYCNVEGVSWLTKNKLVVVSDARKKKQSKKCKDKEQAIHLISDDF